MRLLLEEWKKIWRPGVLGTILVLGILYYFMFPSFYVEYFCNGPSAQAEFDLAAEWVPEYGPTLEQEELPGLEAQLNREIEAFGDQIAAIPQAAAAGLTDYASFLDFEQTYYAQAEQAGGQADMEKEELIWCTVEATNYYRIQELENFLDNYRWKGENPWAQREEFSQYTPQEQTRILALEQGGRGYLPETVQLSTVEYAKDLGAWIVLSNVLLLSPTLVRDRLHRTRSLDQPSGAAHPKHAVCCRDPGCPGPLSFEPGGVRPALLYQGTTGILELSPLQLVPGAVHLVCRNLWPVSVGFGGPPPGHGGGRGPADGLSLPVQRRLRGHALEGHSSVSGGGGLF